MSDSPLNLPLRPCSTSLQSHLAALDLLSLQIESLINKNRHDCRIPLNSKASIKGEIIHTNDIKVNIGVGYYADMTCKEASEYIKRRKELLLLDHARLIEGKSKLNSPEENIAGGSKPYKNNDQPKIGFHPIFYSLPDNIASSSALPENAKPSDSQSSKETPSRAAAGNSPEKEAYVAEENQAKPPTKAINPPQPKSPPNKASLVELLDDEGDSEGEKVDDGRGDDTTLNEEGLPIHEIRETLSGETIGAPPPPSTTIDSKSSTEQKEEDYFSAEAVERRAALRRKLFNEDSSDDEEETQLEEIQPKEESEPIKAKRGIIRPSSASSSSSNSKELNKPTVSSPLSQSHSPSPSNETDTDLPPNPPMRERRPSSSLPAPSKSILKPHKPPLKKKSVSFDPSLPSPPQSPVPDPHSYSQLGRFGYPLPLATDDDDENNEYSVKPVPVIPTPQPGKKKQQQATDSGFAGFKKGFLGRSSSNKSPSPLGSQSLTTKSTVQEKERPKLTAVKDVVSEKPIPTATPSSTKPTQNVSTPDIPQAKPKKQSLFSQRLSKPEIDASAPFIQTTTASTSSSSSNIPNLPKVSESKGTNTIKSGVIEKPPKPSSVTPPNNLEIIERPPTKVAQKGLIDTSMGRTKYALEEDNHTDVKEDYEDEDEDEDEDEFSEYSTGEEDEYDLDEALLAREVALEYHKRQAYKPLNRDPNDPAYDHEDQEDDEDGGGGGVMLGLPRISDLNGNGNDEEEIEGFRQSGRPMIINPKPEDLRRFIRVGKLENGNLVLAPGEESLETDSENELDYNDNDNDDDENNDEEKKQKVINKKERKENRELIKRKLMGLEIPIQDLIAKEREENKNKKIEKGKAKQNQDWKNSLPPSLSTDTNMDNQENHRQEEEQLSKNNSNSINASSKPPIIPLVPESPIEHTAFSKASIPNTSAPLTTSAISSFTPHTPLPVPVPRPTESANQSVSDTPQKPKKVSRFKAARMAAN
ncbi:uncharacterized protein L201_003610 [Kwoniella dendrophila CBS 6074]|uniref:DUF3835 domain-containing protein n=1 Tax=Kwoniella dendrophila CBS 6074 TaxID=1295534 RepID=A0AAX4JTK7_9TREE